jgi:hypothetical protein
VFEPRTAHRMVEPFLPSPAVGQDSGNNDLTRKFLFLQPANGSPREYKSWINEQEPRGWSADVW